MKFRWFQLTLFLYCLSQSALHAEHGPTIGQRRYIKAEKTHEKIKVDGKLDEEAWQHANTTLHFFELEPANGLPERPGFNTEVRILFDDEALYFFAIMNDPSPDSILRELGRRDNVNNNTDWFAVWINPFNDGQNDINFFVSAAGVQGDSRTTINGDDWSWDAVWRSEAIITEYGWQVEIKIPFSALRLPANPQPEWGLNMGRQIRRYRELFTWNFVDKSFGTYEQQNGRLLGLEGINPPVRLSFMPYASAYLNNYDGKSNMEYNAGMDLKYGINEAFTLDFTLVPDFGQVRFDDQVLNLSPFEVRFDEYRQFFTEGTELFNKGQLFYSRRVGGRPYGYSALNSTLGENDSVVVNPTTSQLVNAFKISGRTHKNLGIGVFNAITKPTFATVYDKELDIERAVLTDPRSNYNVLVLDQLFGQNNYVTLINLNTLREGNAEDANVSGLLWQLQNKKNSLRFNGQTNSSFEMYGDSVVSGFSNYLRAESIKGRIRWQAGHYVSSDQFDINDLGFQLNNNDLNHWIGISHRMFEPKGKFVNSRNTVWLEHMMLYKPLSFRYFSINTENFFTFRNFLTLGLFGGVMPTTGYDFFEPRVAGRYLVVPSNYWLRFFYSPDYRKKYVLDWGGRTYAYSMYDRKGWNAYVSPRVRVNNHLSLVARADYTQDYNDMGWVDFNDDEIIIGLRDRGTLINTLTGSYVFNHNTSLNLTFRHYWSTVKYNEYGALRDDGYLDPTSYDKNKDVNYNSWNIDLNFTWWFAPGSQMTFLYRNVIQSTTGMITGSYFENVEELFAQPQQNNLSLRIIYFLDYNYIVKPKSNRPQDNG